MLASYVLDKLKVNSINFALFVAGVVLGFFLVVITYKILSKTKRKQKPLLKKYEDIPAEKDLALIAAKTRMRNAAQNVPVADYIAEAAKTIVEMVGRIAREYTGGSRALTLEFADANGIEKIKIVLDPDFTIENLLNFLDGVADVLENTVLTVTDKYAIALNPVLRAMSLGDSFRSVTAKNVVLYLRKSAEKERKALAKKEEKIIKTERKKLEKGKREEKPKRRLRDLFKKRKKIVEKIVETTEEEKIKAYVKLINSVVLNVVLETLPELAKNARKLYGEGYGGNE